MTITDTTLNEVAKAIANESFLVPNYLATGTTIVTSINTTDTSLSGETGDRIALTGSRTNNEIEFTATRSASDVVDTTNGDAIKSSGLHNTDTAATSDPLLFGVVHAGITQSTDYDLEFIYTVRVQRG